MDDQTDGAQPEGEGEFQTHLGEVEAATMVIRQLDQKIPALQNSLDRSIEIRMTRYRRAMFAFAAILVLMLGLFVRQWMLNAALDDTRQETAVELCIEDNELRQVMGDVIQEIIDAIAPASSDSERVQQFRQDANQALNRLEPQDCDIE